MRATPVGFVGPTRDKSLDSEAGETVTRAEQLDKDRGPGCSSGDNKILRRGNAGTIGL